MAVKHLTSPYVQDDGTIISFCIADTEAERPNEPIGSYCFTKDTNKIWVRNAANAWQEVGGSGGAHPDLATHTGMGLAASHAHPYSSDTHNHDATYSAVGHTHGGGGGEAFPPGSVFISVVPTNPATLLGYGFWVSIASGRMLVGHNSGDPDFDTVEETGGAKTHTLTEAEMPSHTHVENSNNATTGALRGWGAADTSTSTPTATGYTTAATGGGGAHNNMPPYFVVYMWKRTS